MMIEHYPILRLGAPMYSLPDVYKWLKEQKDIHVIAEVPEHYGSDLWGFSSEYMLFSCFHNKKIVNGYSRFVSEEFKKKAKLLHQFPSDESIEQLKEYGIRIIIAHPQRFFDEAISAIFNEAGKTGDISKAIHQINALACRNYEDLHSPDGDAMIEAALNQAKLECVSRFGRDFVFRIR